MLLLNSHSYLFLSVLVNNPNSLCEQTFDPLCIGSVDTDKEDICMYYVDMVLD